MGLQRVRHNLDCLVVAWSLSTAEMQRDKCLCAQFGKAEIYQVLVFVFILTHYVSARAKGQEEERSTFGCTRERRK